DRNGAEKALGQYLNRKHTAAATESCRGPATIPAADVLNLYVEQVVPKHVRPKEALARITRLGVYFGNKALADINGKLCRAYVKDGSKMSAAREELILLRAAINFHREEGHCDRIVSDTLPEKSPGRERWLTRNEAATLIWRAWRYREVQKGHATSRRSRRHVGVSFWSASILAHARVRSAARHSSGSPERAISTSSTAYYIGAQLAPWRRRNVGRPLRCRAGLWRIYDAGKDTGNDSPWNGTARPSRTSIRLSGATRLMLACRT